MNALCLFVMDPLPKTSFNMGCRWSGVQEKYCLICTRTLKTAQILKLKLTWIGGGRTHMFCYSSRAGRWSPAACGQGQSAQPALDEEGISAGSAHRAAHSMHGWGGQFCAALATLAFSPLCGDSAGKPWEICWKGERYRYKPHTSLFEQ